MATMNKLQQELETKKRYFMQYYFDTDVSAGWKLSIQGKTVQDACYLYDRLHQFLETYKVPFKIGTQRLIDLESEQSTKLMTIYVPNNVDVMHFAELVYARIPKYKGWYNIKTKIGYEHYAGGIFFRNDRTTQGTYVPAQECNNN